MAGTTYTDAITGSIIAPTEVSYYALALIVNTQLIWPGYLPPTQTGANPLVPAPRVLDVTPAAGTVIYNIYLPQGNLGSVGTDILVNNKGSTSFTISDVAGGNSTNVAPGSSYYFYLQDNSTTAGVWRSTQFGATTSAADANQLAGAGLTALNGVLNTEVAVVQFNSPGYVVNDASRANAYVWRGGLGSMQLPDPATLSANWFILIRNQGSGTLTLSLPASSTALINQQSSQPVEIGTSNWVVLDSSTGNYFSFGTTNQQFVFTSATYDADGIPINTLSLINGAPVIQRYISRSSTRTQNLAVTFPATSSLYSVVNSTTGAYNITFTISGSTQIPITVPPNTQSFMVSDGINLYSLSSQLVGAVQLNAGSQLAPTLSFFSDAKTGLYLMGPQQLGITAGGQNLLSLNGSDSTNLQLISPATLVVKTIDGGLI